MSVADKARRIILFLTPWREVQDRRQQFDGTYIGPERRKQKTMNESEIRTALNNQFDSLSTTIIKAREIAGDK